MGMWEERVIEILDQILTFVVRDATIARFGQAPERCTTTAKGREEGEVDSGDNGQG